MAAKLTISEVKKYPEPGEILLYLTLRNEGPDRLGCGSLTGTVTRPGHDTSLCTSPNTTELAPGQYIKLFVSLPEGAREGHAWTYVQDDGRELPVAGTVRKKLLGWSLG